MRTEVVIIDSGCANVGSVSYALQRLGARPVLTSDATVVASADRVILPGVGAAGAAMETLRDTGLEEVIPSLDQPLLGICLGMQLLGSFSEEGDAACLGMVDFRAKRLEHARVPHMGWNRLDVTSEASPLMEGMAGSHVYFVHSYAVPVIDGTVATSTHGNTFSAAISSGNVHAVQFHPERSSTAGARLLENFLRL